MGWLIWIGAGVTIAGIAALIACILSVAKARRRLNQAEMQLRLQRVVAYNLGALFLSALGLMMVVVGILLG